jgi:MFS family permease
MAHIFAQGWAPFAGLRLALGLTEGSAQPAGQKLIAEWFPARERGFAGGVYNIGASFGAVFAPMLVAWAVMMGSWRLAFVAAGALGLAWVAAWIIWYQAPAKHRRLAADLGCLFGPAVVAYLQKRGVDLIDARRWAFSLGAVLMTAMTLVGLAANPYVALALLCVGGFAHQTLSVTVITMASDLFRRDEVATVAGFAGLAGNLGVLIFTLALGKLVDQVGYGPFFVMLGLLDLVGAGLLWTLVRKRHVPAS